MTNNFLFQPLIAATFALLGSLTATYLIAFSHPAIAANPPASTIHYSPPPPPVLNDPGGRGGGGASRGSCLVALAPTVEAANRQSLYWGLTTATHPTLWFYVTGKFEPASPIKVSLLNRDRKPVYHVTVDAADLSSGVISVSIPSTVPPLQMNQSYVWEASFRCQSAGKIPTDPNGFFDPASENLVMVISGRIQRVRLSPQLQRQITTAKTDLEQATLYANSGIWHDSLTILGTQLQKQKAEDPAIARAWSELLRQVNLDNAATAPVVPCCTVK